MISTTVGGGVGGIGVGVGGTGVGGGEVGVGGRGVGVAGWGVTVGGGVVGAGVAAPPQATRSPRDKNTARENNPKSRYLIMRISSSVN